MRKKMSIVHCELFRALRSKEGSYALAYGSKEETRCSFRTPDSRPGLSYVALMGLHRLGQLLTFPHIENRDEWGTRLQSADCLQDIRVR
jgi:hypothetical protein